MMSDHIIFISVLVPIIKGTNFDNKKSTLHHLRSFNFQCKKPYPFLKIYSSESKFRNSQNTNIEKKEVFQHDYGKNKCIIFGRREILQAYHAACGCLFRNKVTKKRKTQSNDQNPVRLFDLCERCKCVEKWSMKYISRKMIEIKFVNGNRCSSETSNKNSEMKDLQYCNKYLIRAIGMNAKALIHIDGKRLIGNKGDYARNVKQENDWNGGNIMSTNSILSFQYCKSDEKEKKVIDDKLDFHVLQFRLINLRTKVRDNAHSKNQTQNEWCSTNIKVTRTNKEINEITKYSKHNVESTVGQNALTEMKGYIKKKSHSMHVANYLNKLKTNHSDNNQTQEISNIQTVHSLETEMSHQNESENFKSCQDLETEKTKNTIIYDSELMKSRCEKELVSTLPNKKSSIQSSICCAVDPLPSTKRKINDKYIILLLPIGRTMPKSRLRILNNLLLLKNNVQIVNSVHHIPPPTHIVVDEHTSATSVSKYLGFQSPEEMNHFFKKFQIMTVKPDWVVRFNNGELNSKFDQIWSGLSNLECSNIIIQPQPVKKKKIEIENANKEKTWMKILRGDAFAPITYVKASQANSNNVISRVNQLRAMHSNVRANKVRDSMNDSSSQVQQSPLHAPRNIKLSKLFSELAKEHKSSPLDDIDEWRYYMFTLISGRVKKLHFEIVYNEEVFKNLKKIKGFGNSIISKIKEFLLTGKCERLQELRKDPLRIAMKNMMSIWGVGRVKASELVRLGYRSIDDVRNDLVEDRIILTRNAKIGVQFYEDFLEKISRNEVEVIGNIVINKCKELMPLSEVSIMGSFRRGQMFSGDVDILITHPEYNNSPPSGKLGQIVNTLFSEGHLTHHLNKVEGMNINNTDTEQMATANHHKTKDVLDTFSSSSTTRDSYMGVFASPTFPGKKRRIDIKFYPYRERAYAMLYFTGNGFFNRSMRLWASKEKGMILNDHGLYPLNNTQGDSSMHQHAMISRLEANTERDIFTSLGLQYCKPEERDAFDSVVKDNGEVVDLDFNDSSPMTNSFEEA